MRSFFLAALAVLVVAQTPRAAFADVIVLRADPWCPYNCEPGSDRPGFMIEIAREVLGAYGHEVVYETVSWARGIKQAKDGEIDGVVGAVPEEVPGFHMSPALGRYNESLVFRRGEGRQVAHAQDLAGLRIGAITEYDHSEIIMDYIHDHGDDRSVVQYASGDDALLTNLRKLIAGRIDVVAESRAVVEYYTREMQIREQIDVVMEAEAGNIHIGFSPARQTSQLFSEQFEEGFAALRASGRYAEIMARYGQDPL